MSFELVMPRAGLTMVEGTIAVWHAKEGDAVKKGDIVMEFENEKNTIEFSCTHDGILHIGAPEGTTVAVGEPIGIVAETKEEYDSILKAPPAAAKEESAAASAPAAAPAAASAPAAAPAAASFGGRVRATGLARKIAKERGVDLSQVRGTGPNGRILADDVKEFASGKDAAASTEAGAHDEVKVEKLTGIRRAIAKNMYGSLHDMAQCTAGVEVDVTELLALRKRLVAQEEFIGCKITVNDLISMAAVKMLKKHPTANATFDGEKLSVHSRVNLSIAVAAEDGLMVPVVKNADLMGLKELHDAMKDLAARARDRKLLPDEQSGGTFTVSNVGMFPVDWSTPIINPPQVAILGCGRAVKKFVVVDDEPEVRSMMTIFLTFDHRVFDGLDVGRMLGDVKTLLENPDLITL